MKINGFFERLFGLTGCFSFFSTHKAIHILKEFKPDVVFLGNLHGGYVNVFRLLKFLAKHSIPLVQFMWDEYPMTGRCAYTLQCEKFKFTCFKCPNKNQYPKSWFFDCSRFLQNRKKKAYDMNNICFVGPKETIEKAKESYLLKNHKLYVLNDFIDTQLYSPQDGTMLRKKLGISENQIVVLNVCHYSNPRKGGPFYLELAKKCFDLTNLVFVHVGFTDSKTICPKNFIPIPPEKDTFKMSLFYSIADVFLCTSIADTMPNTCLEALCCGTPIIGFDIPGIRSCAPSPFGTYFKPLSIQDLKRGLSHVKKKNAEDIAVIRQFAVGAYSSDAGNATLLKIVNNMLQSNVKD